MASVLVVDDEKSIRTTLGEFLRMDGYDVQTAEDADAALALMGQCAFDVVVTDIILPRVSGVTLLQRIKERAPDVQVIMMTGEPTVDTAVQAVRAAAHDYLSKPVSKRDLLAAVGQAARFKALMDEKHRLEVENRQYQENLERLVGERTEALAARTRQLEALLRATRSVMAGLDLLSVLDRILTEAAVMSGCPNVKIFHLDRKAGALRVEATRGMAVSHVGSVLPLGTGLTGLAAQTGQPVFSEDLTQDARNPNAQQDREVGFVTYLGLPIRIRDEVLGVLTFRTTAPRHYPPDEVAYLASFADHAAIAIENAQLYAATEQRAKELAALIEIDHVITSHLELPAALEAVVAGAMRILGTQHTQIILWDEATQTLRYGAALGTEAERVRNQTFELGKGINGTVALTRQPMILDDYQATPYVVPECLDVVATITVPILFEDRLLGLLHSHTTQPGRRFTSDDLRRLQMLANQAAIAIENARLYETIRQHAAELEQRVQDRTRELEVANQQLQAASRHKSEFLANMSHELRTPLNSILGFSELLLEQTKNLVSAKQTRFLTNIYTSGQHLLRLISDILDLSKVEAGKITLQPEALAVGVTLEDILVIGRGLANKKGQTIEVHVEPDLPPLHADPVRFKQILFNLLSNAVKFTPERGTITLTARRASSALANSVEREPSSVERLGPVNAPPSTESPESLHPPPSTLHDLLEIAVTDTGLGIKAEDLPRLFQEFVQLETTQAQRHEGTGLGLALTKRLVGLHGGQIWAASEGVGRGSTFTILLPFEGGGT